MKKKVEYSEKDLASLISEVETKFSKHLEKAESDTEEKLETKNTSDLKKSEDEKQDEVVLFDYDDKDIAEMNEMYGSMTKSEKEAHYQSIKKSLFTKEEEIPVEKVVEQKKIAKSEKEEKVVESKENSELSNKLEKSEAKYEDLQKNFQDLLSKLGGFVKTNKPAPKQKAITKIEYVKKSEDEVKKEEEKEKLDIEKLSKNEITVILSEKARNPKLAKNDREAITNYYMVEDNDKNIDSIKHLLGGE